MERDLTSVCSVDLLAEYDNKKKALDLGLGAFQFFTFFPKFGSAHLHYPQVTTSLNTLLYSNFSTVIRVFFILFTIIIS